MRPKGVPILTLQFQFCSHCFIEWSLPCSLVLRNKRIPSSLFLSKTCGNFRSGFEICSCSHRSSLTIIVVAHQRDGAVVLVPLVPRCGVGDVDRREVVQVSAVLLPPDHSGVVIVFSCSSWGIHCFPMVSLPLSFAVFLTS